MQAALKTSRWRKCWRSSHRGGGRLHQGHRRWCRCQLGHWRRRRWGPCGGAGAGIGARGASATGSTGTIAMGGPISAGLGAAAGVGGSTAARPGSSWPAPTSGGPIAARPGSAWAGPGASIGAAAAAAGGGLVSASWASWVSNTRMSASIPIMRSMAGSRRSMFPVNDAMAPSSAVIRSSMAANGSKMASGPTGVIPNGSGGAIMAMVGMSVRAAGP